MYAKVIKPVLFLIHPDIAHKLVVKIGHLLGQLSIFRNLLKKYFVVENQVLNKKIWGINFKNPIGLAGGFDKNAELIQIIPCVGFGFMEVGSITRFPYAGNTRPWITRLPKDKSLLVNYGLKNKGVDVLEKVIRETPRELPIIANIAKTNDKNISGNGTIEDYLYSYKKLEPVADIININISCPNTGDGVLLCEDMILLEKLVARIQHEFDQTKAKKPVVVKIKPDLSKIQLKEIVEIVKRYPCIKGFVISNLSKNRKLIRETPQSFHEQCAGGVSGAPIRQISTQMIKDVRELAGEKYIIIGCGGIFSAEDAYEKLEAGANLLELITGMIYEGPGLVKKINEGLIRILSEKGIKNINEI